MQAEHIRAINESRLIQMEMRWACSILKSARLDGSRLFMDVSILARFVQILSGQLFPHGFYFDRSLPPVTSLRNILNFLHRFGIQTTDINPTNLISGTDNDRYKLLRRLHECFDSSTLSRRDFGPLTVETSTFDLASLGGTLPNTRFGRFNQQAATLAAELRAQDYYQRRCLANCAHSASVSCQLDEIHKLCKEISDNITPRKNATMSPHHHNVDVLSHISLQLGTVNSKLSTIDTKLGAICQKIDVDAPLADAPRMTISRGSYFRGLFSCLSDLSCWKSKSSVKIAKERAAMAKSVASTYNSSLFATSV